MMFSNRNLGFPQRLVATLALCAAFALSLVLAGTANAAVVTVGSTGTPTAEIGVGAPATIFDTSLSAPGANLTSPVSGTVIRWHVTNFSGGPFALQVLTPNGANSYTSTATSGPATPTSKATQTFTTSLPIKAGQMLGVKNTNGSDVIGYFAPAGASSAFFTPGLAEGATGTASTGLPVEYTFNAEVQPLPTITALTPTSGPVTGGTQVTITGTDFENVGAVKFGSTPATAYAVNSETQITAFAPAGSGAVPVTVTTLAGTATALQAYTYAAAPVVPVTPPPPRPSSSPARCRT